jgi:hypothetical protein
MVALVLSACLDAPPGASVGPGEDGGRGMCSWSDPEPLESPIGITGPSLDGSETILVGEEGGELRLYERDTIEDGFGNVGGILDGLNTADVDANPALARDGKDLYFTRGDPELAADVWVTHRSSTDSAFDSAELVDGLSEPATSENGVAVWDGPSGREIIYAIKTGGPPDLAHASCSARVTCEPLGALNGIASDADDNYPSISGDGLDLYFRRYGMGIMSAHRASVDDDFVLDAEQPVENTADFNYYDPEVSEDGNTLYVARRPPAGGEFELAVSHRTCQ